MALHFTTELHDETTVLVIWGEVDIFTQQEFRKELAAIDRERAAIVIDFCRCEYFDTVAMNELRRLRDSRPAQFVALCVPKEFWRNLMRIADMERLFPFIDCPHLRPRKAKEQHAARVIAFPAQRLAHR